MASKEPAETAVSFEELLKICGSLDDQEKLKIFTVKYDELHKLYRNLEFRYNTTKRELSSVNAEKNKQILVRSRLEGLCRELQKQNKVIKDESLLKIREEEEKRKHITQEFQKTLNNVTTMMSESNTQNTKLGEENKQMAQRLSSIYEEFKTRENEVDRISKQIDIERQLSEARGAKMKTEFMIEKQTLIAEKDALNEKLANVTKELLETTKKSITLEQQVIDLTCQLDKYTGKYEEFESTISRSGKVFDHCKAEIGKMNKQISILEKEIVEWQNRYHRSISAMYELKLESAEKTKVIEYITKKQNQLTKLCRQLQSERKAYINTLRSLGQNPSDVIIEVIDEDPDVDEPTPSTSKSAEMASPASPPSTSEEISGDSKSSGKTKPASKTKRGKQKGKKGKVEIQEQLTPPMTLKELKLQEFKQQLQRMQNQVSQMQSNMGQETEQTSKEVSEDTSQNNEGKDAIPAETNAIVFDVKADEATAADENLFSETSESISGDAGSQKIIEGEPLETFNEAGSILTETNLIVSDRKADETLPNINLLPETGEIYSGAAGLQEIIGQDSLVKVNETAFVSTEPNIILSDTTTVLDENLFPENAGSQEITKEDFLVKVNEAASVSTETNIILSDKKADTTTVLDENLFPESAGSQEITKQYSLVTVDDTPSILTDTNTVVCDKIAADEILCDKNLVPDTGEIISGDKGLQVSLVKENGSDANTKENF